MKQVLLSFFLIGSVCAIARAQCGVECGSERWSVKTASDSTVNKIKKAPVKKTVHWLFNATPPTGPKPPDERINGLEWRKFKVKAVLVGYKKEADDHDFHVVIADLNNPDETMIVEFPDIACSGVCESKYKKAIKRARADFLSSDFITELGNPTSTFKTLTDRVVVEVIGIGFWDFSHHQTGRAPNDIELHPVISFRIVP